MSLNFLYPSIIRQFYMSTNTCSRKKKRKQNGWAMHTQGRVVLCGALTRRSFWNTSFNLVYPSCVKTFWDESNYKYKMLHFFLLLKQMKITNYQRDFTEQLHGIPMMSPLGNTALSYKWRNYSQIRSLKFFNVYFFLNLTLSSIS